MIQTKNFHSPRNEVLMSTTHGCSHTRLYKTWRNMKTRCNTSTDPHYPRWGGRGIKVCKAWNDSFVEFQEWALASGYRDDLTLDRIDVDGNYEPTNCKWATQKEQANNKRNNHFLELNGEKHTINQWAEITGLSRILIRDRINKLHWSVEAALTTPPLKQKKKAVMQCVS